MSEWKEYKLAEVCKKIGSGATPRGGSESYLPDGEYSLIRSQNVLDFIFSEKGLAYINKEQATKLNNVEVQERDILINITGDSVARVCQVPSRILPSRVNQHVAIIRPVSSILNHEFLKYYLLEPKNKEYLLMLSSSGATRNAITKNMLEEFVISAPELNTQNIIAEILSSLDDKIELNNKINQELESLAQLLFKRWFVDFEFPNENGEPYKSSGGEMINSELGEIPKGWEVRDLGSISRLIAGGDKPLVVSEEQNETCKVPIFSNGITNYGLYGYTNVAKIFEESVTVSARGTIGFACLRTQPYFPIVRLISIIPTDVRISSKYLYMWLRSSNISGTGTTQQQLTVPDFTSFKVLVPNESTNKKYTSTLNNLFDTMQTNNDESKNLSKLRDILIPLLISGKIKIKEN